MDTMQKHLDRKFGYSIIEWEIRDFFLLKPFNGWKILSPNIYTGGILKATWIMTLIRTSTDSNPEPWGYFKLKVLDILECETKSKNMSIECKLHFKNNFANWCMLKDKSFFSYPRSDEFVMELFDFNPWSFHLKDVSIKCELLIRFDDFPEEISPCSDLGLKMLSDDLCRLIQNGEEVDMVLNIKSCFPEDYILAHKPILYTRNFRLAKTISSNYAADGYILGYTCDPSAWKKSITFLYTGNMEHAVNPPTLDFYEIATMYDIQPIRAYYAPDEMKLCSSVHAEEFFIEWRVDTFLDIEEYCYSSPVMKTESDTTLQLRFYPRSFADENSACLCLEIISRKMKMASIEFRLGKNRGNDFIKQAHGEVKSDEVLKKYMFINRDQMNNYLENGNCKVVIKLHLVNWDNFSDWRVSAKNSVEKYISRSGPYCDQTNYDRLSDDMLQLYGSDVGGRVQLNVHGEAYFVHDSILAARLPTLYRRIDETGILNIHGIRPYIVSILIRYLYSGELKVLPAEDMFELYNIAVEFNAVSLYESIRDILYQLIF